MGEAFKARLEAAAKAAADKKLANKPPQDPFAAQVAQRERTLDKPLVRNDKTVYFHSSHKAFTFLDNKDQKARFEDYFFITHNPDLIEHIRKEFVNKKGGSLKVREVNHFFYEQAHTIQPQFMPLPEIPEEPNKPVNQDVPVENVEETKIGDIQQ